MSEVMAKALLLASKSTARLDMIKAAGVSVDAVAPMVDEENVRDVMISDGASAHDMADALAEAKAVKISRKYPDMLVLGSDQILARGDGTIMGKAESPDDAKEKLSRLSGQTHRLYSAAVIAEAGKPIWSHVDKADLTMRMLSASFIDYYVERYWEEIRPCVGCYRIEAEGVQLFSQVEGSQFTIMGMPLLQILDFLREQGNLPS